MASSRACSIGVRVTFKSILLNVREYNANEEWLSHIDAKKHLHRDDTTPTLTLATPVIPWTRVPAGLAAYLNHLQGALNGGDETAVAGLIDEQKLADVEDYCHRHDFATPRPDTLLDQDLQKNLMVSDWVVKNTTKSGSGV